MRKAATTVCILVASIQSLSSVCLAWSSWTKERSKSVSSSNSKQKPIPQPPPPPPEDEEGTFSIIPKDIQLPDVDIPNPITPSLWNSATSSLLGLAASLAPKDVKRKSDRAARLTVNSLPPQSVEIDLKDVHKNS